MDKNVIVLQQLNNFETLTNENQPCTILGYWPNNSTLLLKFNHL